MVERHILPPRRARHVVYGELLAAEKHYTVLRNVAADFHALDARPFFIDMETGEIEKIGTFVLPKDLTDAINDAAVRFAELRMEFHEVSQ